VLYGLYLAASALLLWAGIDLLRQRDWARRTIVGALFLGIAGCLAVVLAVAILAVVAILEARVWDPVSFVVGLVIVVLLLTGSGGAAALQWWVARRLQRPEVRSEFPTEPPPGR
jgi:hypothetical protein